VETAKIGAASITAPITSNNAGKIISPVDQAHTVKIGNLTACKKKKENCKKYWTLKWHTCYTYNIRQGETRRSEGVANMSYCMFQNTEGDLRDCVESLEEMEDFSNLSESEMKSAKRMRRLCSEFIEYFDSIEDE
jgi:hypothetical protein